MSYNIIGDNMDEVIAEATRCLLHHLYTAAVSAVQRLAPALLRPCQDTVS